jgi:hypothetical protein
MAIRPGVPRITPGIGQTKPSTYLGTTALLVLVEAENGRGGCAANIPVSEGSKGTDISFF